MRIERYVEAPPETVRVCSSVAAQRQTAAATGNAIGRIIMGGLSWSESSISAASTALSPADQPSGAATDTKSARIAGRDRCIDFGLKSTDNSTGAPPRIWRKHGGSGMRLSISHLPESENAN